MRPISRAFFLTICLGVAATAIHAESRSAPQGAAALLQNDAEADAALFTLEVYFNGENDLTAVRRLYAESVLYFDRGLQPIETVMADKRAYIARWPERRFSPDLTTLRVTPARDGAFAVAVEADFAVANGARRIEGRALAQLTLARIGGDFRIVQESGHVLERWRDDP